MEYPIHPAADLQSLFFWFQMDIAGASGQSLIQDLLGRLDSRGLRRCAAPPLERTVPLEMILRMEFLLLIICHAFSAPFRFFPFMSLFLHLMAQG